MFFVSDTQKQRHKMIRSYLAQDRAPIAVVLAAVDFEWTVRRAIMALGSSPTPHIRKVVMKNISGLRGYKESWKAEVQPRLKLSLPQVIPHWSNLTDAFVLRGKLVHGVVGSVKFEHATPSVEVILSASKLLEELAAEQGTTLYRRIVRRKPRGPQK